MDEEKVTLWKQRMTSFQSSGLSRTKSFACKTLARPRYCAAINSISAVCASSRSVFYVIGNCIAISYYIKKWCRENHIASPTFYYWRSRLENEIVTNQPTFVEVKQIEKNIVPTQAHHIAMSWKELHFEIASKEVIDVFNKI